MFAFWVFRARSLHVSQTFLWNCVLWNGKWEFPTVLGYLWLVLWGTNKLVRFKVAVDTLHQQWESHKVWGTLTKIRDVANACSSRLRSECAQLDVGMMPEIRGLYMCDIQTQIDNHCTCVTTMHMERPSSTEISFREYTQEHISGSVFVRSLHNRFCMHEQISGPNVNGLRLSWMLVGLEMLHWRTRVGEVHKKGRRFCWPHAEVYWWGLDV